MMSAIFCWGFLPLYFSSKQYAKNLSRGRRSVNELIPFSVATLFSERSELSSTFIVLGVVVVVVGVTSFSLPLLFTKGVSTGVLSTSMSLTGAVLVVWPTIDDVGSIVCIVFCFLCGC